jgi:hypothetical protein
MYIFCGSSRWSQRVSLDEAKTLTYLKTDKRLGIINKPDPINSWTDNLHPAEGDWYAAGPVGATVEIDWYSPIGPDPSISINTVGNPDRYFADLRFALHNGQEFNGNQQQAQLHFWLMSYSGSNFITGHDSHITLYDAAGRYADMEITTRVGYWDHFELNLGAGSSGWNVQEGFDWSYIKEIAFRRWGFLNDHMDVWQLYFSYYKLVPPLLNINSDPSGVQFAYDSVIRTTPWYINPAPGVATQIRMDPTNFVKWEDESTNPVRSITLAEGETKTIIAYYSAKPPNGGDNTILIVGVAVAAIIGIGALYLFTKGFK